LKTKAIIKNAIFMRVPSDNGITKIALLETRVA
jgi:hypothetical protein